MIGQLPTPSFHYGGLVSQENGTMCRAFVDKWCVGQDPMEEYAQFVYSHDCEVYEEQAKREEEDEWWQNLRDQLNGPNKIDEEDAVVVDGRTRVDFMDHMAIQARE